MIPYSKIFPVMLIVFFCTAALADSQESVIQETVIQIKVIESSDYLKEVLPKIAQVAKELKEKEFYRLVSSVPTDTEIEQCRKTIDEHLRFIRDTTHTLDFSPMDQSIEIHWHRKDRAELYLALLKATRESLGPCFDSASYFLDPTRPVAQARVWPEKAETDDTGQFFLPGMAPEDIIHPETREKYRVALWENSKIGLDNKIDRVWIDLLDKVPDRTNSYLVWAYRQEPRADQKLIDLLEKYDYPEEERIKILEVVNMSNEEYQKWRQGGRTVESVLAVHVLQEGEVRIRNPDGSFSVSKETETTYTYPHSISTGSTSMIHWTSCGVFKASDTERTISRKASPNTERRRIWNR